MVMGICRRSLVDVHDAEDAFQATFLVLVKRATTIRRRDSLSCWLHGVARRVLADARALQSPAGTGMSDVRRRWRERRPKVTWNPTRSRLISNTSSMRN